jgi:hypothetical protein
MSERLVVVQETFVASGRGAVVSPRISLPSAAPTGPFAVRLRLPDGTERAATASFDVAHIRGPLAPFAMVRLLDCAPSDVPAGTEIWTA